MNCIVGLIFFIFAFVVIFCATEPLEASQSWNCSTGTNLCILSPQMRLSWHDASMYCFQRNGGLTHSNHSKVRLPFFFLLITFILKVKLFCN